MPLNIGAVTPGKIYCTTASDAVELDKVYVGDVLVWKDDFENVRSLSFQWGSSDYLGVRDALAGTNYFRENGATDDVLFKISSPEYSLSIADKDLSNDGMDFASVSKLSFSSGEYPNGYRLPFKAKDVLTIELLAPAVNKELVCLQGEKDNLYLNHTFFVQGDTRFDSAQARIFGKAGHLIELSKKNTGEKWEVSEDGELELTLTPGSYYLYASYPKGETMMTLQQDAVRRSYSVTVSRIALA